MSEIAREAADNLPALSRAELVIPRELPCVSVDRARIVEVLQNLLGNAIKFMGDEPRPRIEVSTRESAADTVFFVADNGVGIEPRHHESVFGLFERLDPRLDGSGVGLADRAARGRAARRAHLGRVGGPWARGALLLHAAGRGRARVTTAADTPVILLVEDDPDHTELVRRAIEELGRDVRLVALADGEIALDYLFRRGEWVGPGAQPETRSGFSRPAAAAARRLQRAAQRSRTPPRSGTSRS